MGDTGLGGVGASTTELLLRNVLSRHGLDDIGAGDEHEAGGGGVRKESDIGRKGSSSSSSGRRS